MSETSESKLQNDVLDFTSSVLLPSGVFLN